MIIEVLTIFPEIFETPVRSSLLGKAQEAGILNIRATDIRSFATDKHRTVDDTPFGGGAGMVMKVEPIDRALEHLLKSGDRSSQRIILTSASGKKLDQNLAREWSREERIIIICGRYKGVDERLLALYPIEEISIGDYVLSGGEAAALVIIEAVARLLPGYMGNQEAAEDDSFSTGILGYPVYTQPQEYKGLRVPEVLISGHHAHINEFRKRAAIEKTRKNRPELLQKEILTEEDKKILKQINNNENMV